MGSRSCKVRAVLAVLLVMFVLARVPVLRATNENELPAPVRQLTASVNTRRLANVLSDEFVSFSAKPQDIFDGQGNPICETSFLMAQSLGRTYLKVVADSSQLHLQTAGGRSVIGGPDDAALVQIKAGAWQAFYDWAQRAGVVPVFVLDYPSAAGTWDAKRALQVLTAASGLGIDECRWQLGNGNVADGPKYWEDLRTFRTMLTAFPKQRWGLVACELSPNGPLEELQYFHANIDSLVDAVTISQPIYGDSAWNYSTLQREVHLRGLSRQRPALWLNLEDQRGESVCSRQSSCDARCLREGLEFARTLGEAARGGVAAVFKPVNRGAIQQYTLDYLTALLYKRTVGSRVFPVQLGPQDAPVSAGRATSVYAYCTRNVTGSVTLVVINERPAEATNATIKLMTRAPSSPVELYLVSVHDGQPMVNNRAFLDGSAVPELEPVQAVTTLSGGVSFYVPAQTILFAVVPGVQVRECRTNGPPSARWPEPVEKQDTGAYDRTSTDALLQELIGTLLEQASLEPLQRKRRAAEPDSPLQAKRKRFLARFAGASADGDLAAGLAQALAGAQPEPAGPTERSARGPRQTQAYRRQQRRVRQKEKRSEKRNLRRMKHPLLESHRERTKRGGSLVARRARRQHQHPHHRFHERLLKRMSAKLASRKTKRSSLAEAVNEPPSFGASEEDPQGRSDFPLGDVHLVISKTAGAAAEAGGHSDERAAGEFSDEPQDGHRRPANWRTARLRSGVRRRITVSKRDFHRFGPRPELDSGEVDCKYRRRTSRRQQDREEMEAKETKRMDRYFPIALDRPGKDGEDSHESGAEPAQRDDAVGEPFTIAQTRNNDDDDDDDDNEEDGEGGETAGQGEEKLEESAQTHHDSTEQQPETPFEEAANEPPTAESDEMNLFTPAPPNAEERPAMPWTDPPQWSLESTSAEVAEVLHHRRYKRSDPSQLVESAESREVERLEDFFRTNAKLQQKFAEMFDLLLEAIEELESEENDAKEVAEEDGEGGNEMSENDAHHRRSKRNALLHPQSWESRERSNMIRQRQEASMESSENRVIPVVRNERADSQPAEQSEATEGDTPADQEPPVANDEGKPGAFVLRTVVNFVRRATSEFHQLFSGWFKQQTSS